MLRQEILKQLNSKNIVVHQDVDLAGSTTIRIPLIASLFCEISAPDELSHVLRCAHNLQIKSMVIGGGSNVAAVSARFEGLVIRNKYQDIVLIEEERDIVDLQVGSGVVINRLVQYTIERGWQGLEYQMGLPGTLGGALCMNSKWMKPPSAVSDVLVSAQLINQSGDLRTVDRNYFKFAYDYSILQDTHEICTSAVLRFTKTEPEILKKRAQEVLAYRQQTQPSGWTSGCFFRNITKQEQLAAHLDTTSAGALIDRAGLKGQQIGGCKISEKHANFIINTGGGTSADVKALVQLIRDTVKQKFSIELKEEVVFV